VLPVWEEVRPRRFQTGSANENHRGVRQLWPGVPLIPSTFGMVGLAQASRATFWKSFLSIVILKIKGLEKK
jgi:hypothetical protein